MYPLFNIILSDQKKEEHYLLPLYLRQMMFIKYEEPNISNDIPIYLQQLMS